MTISADRLATRSRWRARLHEVIFEADTPAGRAFDICLLVAILMSVIAVMLESVAGIRREYGGVLRAMEWTLTVVFTIEYALRLVAVDRPWRYARSFCVGRTGQDRSRRLPARRARPAAPRGTTSTRPTVSTAARTSDAA